MVKVFIFTYTTLFNLWTNGTTRETRRALTVGRISFNLVR